MPFPRKNVMHLVLAAVVLLVLGFGIDHAVHSSLFELKNAEVTPFSDGYPLTIGKVLEMARVPVGRANLFSLDLAPIEARLLKNPWVKGVVLSKQFPNTLSIRVIERQPIALLSLPKGEMAYLEKDGILFEDSALIYAKDLPILNGFSESDPQMLQKVNHFIADWFSNLKVSSVSYDPKLGFRAIISYPMKNQQLMRTVLELGINVDEASAIPEERLLKVLNYLSQKSMQASKIWLGDGKKIVVRVARGT